MDLILYSITSTINDFCVYIYINKISFFEINNKYNFLLVYGLIVFLFLFFVFIKPKFITNYKILYKTYVLTYIIFSVLSLYITLSLYGFWKVELNYPINSLSFQFPIYWISTFLLLFFFFYRKFMKEAAIDSFLCLDDDIYN